MIGQTIAHYKILEKLGVGGMGVVYKAEDTRLKRTVAIKVLPPELTRDPGATERFMHEAQAASALEHANICSIHEIGEHEGRTFLVMGYYEGETLKTKIGRGPLGPDEAADIIQQAAQGLSKAHEAGIVHRDIKPANLIITKDGVVKILDFGLAKMTGRSLLTKSGTTLGTAAYMSPEQARGEGIDHRTDIWSLGVTFYEMLTGRRPFESDYEQALVYSILNEEPKPLRKVQPDVPEGLEKICLRAMTKRPEERYQSAAELVADLDAYRTGGQISRTGRKTLSRRRMMISAAVIIVLVVLSLIFNPFNLKVGLQENAASPKPSLAVMTFENIPDPSDKDRTGEMLTNYLITSFFQTKDLDVVSRERLYDIQRSLGQGESKIISSTMASQIAQRARVSTMMLASILQLQPTVIVTYRVIDVGTGNIINSQRVTANPADKLYALADTLAVLVKADLHVKPSQGTSQCSVAEVTTRSPEAYRAYLAGIEEFANANWRAGTDSLRKAVALDSMFAMAHYAFKGFHDTAEIRKAWNLRNNVTELERLLIEAAYLGMIEEDPMGWVRMLEQIANKYPREHSVYGQAMITLSHYCGQDQRAIEMGERGLRNDSLDIELWNEMGYLLAVSGKRQEALRAIDRYIALAPAQHNSNDSKGDILFICGETDSALQYWRMALAFGGQGSGVKAGSQYVVRGEYSQASELFQKARLQDNPQMGRMAGQAMVDREMLMIPVHRGELQKALRSMNNKTRQHLRRSETRGMVAGFPLIVVSGDYLYLVSIAYELGDYGEMLRCARERSAEIVAQKLVVPWDPTNPVAGRYEIAWALLKSGQKEESSRLMEELKKVQKPTLPQRQREYDYFAGLCAFESGDFKSAVSLFGKSLNTFPAKRQPQYHYAVALLKTGDLEAAIPEFQRMIWWSSVMDAGETMPLFSPMYNYWAIAAVKAHYWLGVAYEEQGKKEQAVKEYATFLDIWKNADFPSDELKDARIRRSKLKEH